MSLYSSVSGASLQMDVQDNIPQSQNGGCSSPAHLCLTSPEEDHFSPQRTLFSAMKHKNPQPDHDSPNGISDGCLLQEPRVFQQPNMHHVPEMHGYASPIGPSNRSPPQDPGVNLQPTCIPVHESARGASDQRSFQQTCEKELGNPLKSEAGDKSGKAGWPQTEVPSCSGSSEEVLAESAYTMPQEGGVFMPPCKKQKIHVINPNAAFKAACDSIAGLRTRFDHYAKEQMETLVRLAPSLLWVDTPSSPGALKAMETIQTVAMSCDNVLKFLNGDPTCLSVGRRWWGLRQRGAGRVTVPQATAQKKGRCLKANKFWQRVRLTGLKKAKLVKPRHKRSASTLKLLSKVKI